MLIEVTHCFHDSSELTRLGWFHTRPFQSHRVRRKVNSGIYMIPQLFAVVLFTSCHPSSWSSLASVLTILVRSLLHITRRSCWTSK